MENDDGGDDDDGEEEEDDEVGESTEGYSIIILMDHAVVRSLIQ
jgi:hypothetical protein